MEEKKEEAKKSTEAPKKKGPGKKVNVTKNSVTVVRTEKEASEMIKDGWEITG